MTVTTLKTKNQTNLNSSQDTISPKGTQKQTTSLQPTPS